MKVFTTCENHKFQLVLICLTVSFTTFSPPSRPFLRKKHDRIWKGIQPSRNFSCKGFKFKSGNGNSWSFLKLKDFCSCLSESILSFEMNLFVMRMVPTIYICTVRTSLQRSYYALVAGDMTMKTHRGQHCAALQDQAAAIGSAPAECPLCPEFPKCPRCSVTAVTAVTAVAVAPCSHLIFVLPVLVLLSSLTALTFWLGNPCNLAAEYCRKFNEALESTLNPSGYLWNSVDSLCNPLSSCKLS